MKLNKPRAFAASPNSLMVNFGTEEREVTNLTRLALLIQTTILVADGGKWHEVEVSDLALDSVHLPSFKNYVEQHGILLSDIRIIETEPMTNHELKHDDFMSLQTAYPKHNYIDVQKLHRYENKRGNPSSRAHLIKVLKAISQDFLHIDGWMSATEERREEILKSSSTTLSESLEVPYEEVVNTDTPQQTIIADTIPITEQEEEAGMSISIFDNLTPEKITELSVLRKEQEQIVKDNPVIVITDKTTYVSAKKTKAVLLSASTRINGKNGLFTVAKKALNDFKKAFDLEGDNIEALARTEHDKQAKLITDWDNRILLQTQNRIKELCAVPFVFDGVNYTIGIMTVTPLEIETLNDVMFSDIVEKGKNIQIALESAKLEQNKEIEALKETNRLLMEKLDAILKLQGMSNEPAGEEAVTINAPTAANPITNPFAPVSTQSIIDHQNTARNEQKEQEQPKLPNPNNKLLNAFYMRNLEIVESERFQEDAALFAQVLSDAGEAIQDILLNPDVTIQKSVAITELIKTWKL